MQLPLSGRTGQGGGVVVNQAHYAWCDQQASIHSAPMFRYKGHIPEALPPDAGS